MILGSEFQTLLLFGKHFDVKLGFLEFQILAQKTFTIRIHIDNAMKAQMIWPLVGR